EVVVTWAESLKAEGRTEGRTEGRAEAILDILTGRGLVLAEPAREQIMKCRDLATLRAWTLRAVTVASADELIPPAS
ncbi:MAG: hypothetical protein WCI05_15510, partial [Myxococcales bacterium]